MKKINSLNNPIIQYLITLHKSKNRYQNQQFLVEGWHLVKEALENKIINTIFLVEEELEKFQTLFKTQVKLVLITKIIMKKISQNVSNQGIIALCQFYEHKVKNDNNILLLDNIQDPSNLGTILRSCAAFKIEKVFLSHNSVDIYNHKVINASQGAIFRVNFSYCNFSELILTLKKQNYYFYGTFLHENQSSKKLNELKFHKKNAFVFGNEGQGINLNLRNLIDENFIIKTTNQVESLNLATSVSITLYSLFIANNLE